MLCLNLFKDGTRFGELVVFVAIQKPAFICNELHRFCAKHYAEADKPLFYNELNLLNFLCHHQYSVLSLILVIITSNIRA